ncbi:MAG: cob(I)yrinic acid a,c-diamide adenosyltransferase [Myxococcaceae bacterium]
MKIYTKRGDTGETDLFGGARVSKANPRVLAYGSVDNANAAIGYAAVIANQPELARIMSDLFDLGSELATAPHKTETNIFLNSNKIEALEKLIDQADLELPALKNFVLPTGCELASRFHLARTAVRSAEQQVIALRETGESVRPELIIYLNRLSDLLFTWSRLANIQSHTPEVLWVKN